MQESNWIVFFIELKSKIIFESYLIHRNKTAFENLYSLNDLESSLLLLQKYSRIYLLPNFYGIINQIVLKN